MRTSTLPQKFQKKTFTTWCAEHAGDNVITDEFEDSRQKKRRDRERILVYALLTQSKT